MQQPLFFHSHHFWKKKAKQWRSVAEQAAKYSRCVHVRARLSRTTSPALTMPCNWGENKDRNYMFIFDNNFNLLCSPSENETPTKKGAENLFSARRLRVQFWTFGCYNKLKSQGQTLFGASKILFHFEALKIMEICLFQEDFTMYFEVVFKHILAVHLKWKKKIKTLLCISSNEQKFSFLVGQRS